MPLNTMRILIVSDHPQADAAVTAHIVSSLDADVTVVDTIEEAKALAAPDAFDVILASDNLSDGNALSLADEDNRECAPPLILLGDQPDAQQALAALRGGAADFLARPIDTNLLLAVIERAVRNRREQRRRDVRIKRLRGLSSRLIRDRRELRQRVDLICRDIVHAYRRLVEKAVRPQDHQFASEPPPRIESYGRNM
ncbi:MAG: response regulator [Phycisphaerae bacterium]|nr:response regulator [Phycisphaerae bacterium]